MRLGQRRVELERPIHEREALRVRDRLRDVAVSTERIRHEVRHEAALRQRRRVVGIDGQRRVEHADRLVHEDRVTRVDALASQQVKVVGLDIGLCDDRQRAVALQFCLERFADQGSNLVLHREHVGEVAVVGLREQVEAVTRLD